MPEPAPNPEPTIPGAEADREIIPFAVPSEYEAAVDRALMLAEAEVLVFDRDLEHGGWNSPARIDVLRALLLGKRRSRMEIVVHDTLHIERNLPRLQLLLRDFSYKLSILRTVDEGRKASEGFILVDGRHVVHRFHFDSLRGELALNAPLKVRQLRSLHDEILGFTEPGVNATQLGL